MARRYDCVLFDFGGVFTVSPFGANAQIAVELGVEPQLITELVFGSYSDDTDHPWHRLERGEISLGESRDAIMAGAREHGLELDPIQVLVRASQNGAIHETVVDAVRTLRADGYRTGMVTNNVVEFRDRWRAMLPVDELFDTIVDSSEVGVRKPDPEIFHIALRELDLRDATRCIFLDDFPGNLDAASALGMQTILVTDDPTPALTQLTHLTTP